MKENVRTLPLEADLSVKDLLYGLAAHAGSAALGFFLSRVAVSGTALPFGISMVSGCPNVLLPGALFGVIAGYLFPAGGIGVFRYIAACLAAVAIRVLCNGVTHIGKKPLFLLCVSAAVSLATGLVTSGDRQYAMLFIAAEAALSGGGAYFVSHAFRAVRHGKSAPGNKEFCSAVIVLSVAVTGVMPFTIGGISLGGILAAALIISAARYGGTSAGAVTGTCVAAAAALTGCSALISMMYALGGLVCGMFREAGKYAQIFSFLGVAVICAVTTGISAQTAAPVIEACFGAAAFLILPRSIQIKTGRLFSGSVSLIQPVSLKRALTMRLDFAASALSDVSVTVEQVARELSRINTPDFGTVITGIKNDACQGCTLSEYCWDAKKELTVSAITEMTEAVKHGEYAPEGFAPPEFRNRCLRTGAVAAAVYHNFSDYTARLSAENRIDEVRAVVSDQFDGISSMLSDLVREFENDEQYDPAAAGRISQALKGIGICCAECVCRTDKYGRITVEATAPDNGFGIINKLQIMRTAGSVCEREFDAPTVTRTGGEVILKMNERARYTAEVGVEQIVCAKSTMCGDSYNYFYDGKGRLIFVLSDGMGCGGRAAVDSAMATGLMSRLLKAGFGFDCSLRILNSSMLFKSTDESLATVDIACVDLFTGNTDLLKAGAAPTLVRRNGKTGKAQSTSLPAGILREIAFDKATIRLNAGDILLLISDGVTSEGTEWICAELEGWGNGSAQQLSERIAALAKEQRTDNHEDDITVIAAIIERA